MNIKADLASLEPKNEFTRRDFVVTMCARLRPKPLSTPTIRD